MLDNLFDLVKGLSEKAVINNPAIPNEHNDAVVAEATNTVASGFQNMIAGGGLENILSLFGNAEGQGNTSASILNNPIVNMMIGHFSGKLKNKFNLQGTEASNVANDLIPSVINGLINKTNDPNNTSFTIDHLLHSLTGGESDTVVKEQEVAGNSGFNFQDLIGQFTGGGQKGGGNGLMDIISKITSSAQNAQASQGSGGLMDLIKGFIK